MREEIAKALRYDPILRREVVVRLTYIVGVGHRPDIVRWFLVKEEVQGLQDSQSLNSGDGGSHADPSKTRGAAPGLRPAI
jgi:hypothetical protein